MIINLDNEEKIVQLKTLEDFAEDLTINLNKPGATVVVAGILEAKNTDQIDFHIEVVHNSPNTTSDVLIRSVLRDRAVVNLTGLVKIKKGAKNANSFLKEDALMLSPDAQAWALPSLEIEENEVKAGHSSFVGPVDREQIFYLMSKGVAEKKAEKMVASGFIGTVVDKIKTHAKRR